MTAITNNNQNKDEERPKHQNIEIFLVFFFIRFPSCKLHTHSHISRLELFSKCVALFNFLSFRLIAHYSSPHFAVFFLRGHTCPKVSKTHAQRATDRFSKLIEDG